MENVRTDATKGVICTLIKIGSAKKNQKSCTSGGVVRKNSMTNELNCVRIGTRDIRPKASPSPNGIPKNSARANTFMVFQSPSNRKSMSARVAAKSHSCNAPPKSAPRCP